MDKHGRARMKALLLAGFGMTCALIAEEEAKQTIQVTNTQRMDFPAGGVLRLKNSTGVLTVEGWDQPEVEITTIKATKREYSAGEREKAAAELDKVRVAVERQANELVVTTDFPRYHAFPPPVPFRSQTRFSLEYRIKVPRDTRLIVEHHDAGEVNVDDLTSDIDATLLQGEIMLHLPEEGVYTIRAKSDFGHVNSDFPGLQKATPWIFGHRVIAPESPASRKLNLRVGYGDIVILKTSTPKEPAPLTSTPSGGGQ